MKFAVLAVVGVVSMFATSFAAPVASVSDLHLVERRSPLPMAGRTPGPLHESDFWITSSAPKSLKLSEMVLDRAQAIKRLTEKYIELASIKPKVTKEHLEEIQKVDDAADAYVKAAQKVIDAIHLAQQKRAAAEAAKQRTRDAYQAVIVAKNAKFTLTKHKEVSRLTRIAEDAHKKAEALTKEANDADMEAFGANVNTLGPVLKVRELFKDVLGINLDDE